MESQMMCEAFKCGLPSYVIIGVEIWEENSLQSSFPPKSLRLLTNNSNVSFYKDHLQVYCKFVKQNE